VVVDLLVFAVQVQEELEVEDQELQQQVEQE
jgi:hypothetical protein